jgi:hypothetical protein
MRMRRRTTPGIWRRSRSAMSISREALISYARIVSRLATPMLSSIRCSKGCTSMRTSLSWWPMRTSWALRRTQMCWRVLSFPFARWPSFQPWRTFKASITAVNEPPMSFMSRTRVTNLMVMAASRSRATCWSSTRWSSMLWTSISSSWPSRRRPSWTSRKICQRKPPLISDVSSNPYALAITLSGC